MSNELLIFPTNLRLAIDSRGSSITQVAKLAKIPYRRLKILTSDLNQKYSSLFQPEGHSITEKELTNLSAVLYYPTKFFTEKPIEIYEPRICVNVGVFN